MIKENKHIIKSISSVILTIIFGVSMIISGFILITESKSSDKKPTKTISKESISGFTIDELWTQVNETLKSMGRPDRLYKIDPQKTAFLIIDMQDAFVAPWGSIENPDTRKIVKNINALTKICREANIPVIWVRFIIRKGNINAGLWPLFQPASPYKGRKTPTIELSENGSEIKIWRELTINSEKDIDVVKDRYSAFIPGSSDLERVLRSMGKDTIIITGVGTNVCCESTARDAMMLDFKVIFVSDANATIGKVFHEITLMNIKMFFGDVVTTKEVIGELAKETGMCESENR